MKKLLLIALMLVTVVLAVSCGDSGVSNNDATDLVKIEDFAEYRIVRGDNCSEEVKALVPQLNNAIKAKLGAMLKVATDATATTKEILIGETKRGQSKETVEPLTYNDFVIKQIGPKIVIVGGSDEATAEAVKYFIENYINEGKKCLEVPTGDGYAYMVGYKIDKFTIENVDIKDFKITVLFETDAITDFNKTLLTDYLGYELAVNNGEMVEGEHYIVLDSTQLDYDEYKIEVKDGNLYLRGSYSSIVGAIEELYKIMDASNGTLNITSSDSFEGKIETPEIPYKNKEELMKVLQFLHDDDRFVMGQHCSGAYDINNAVIKDYYDAVGEDLVIVDFDMYTLRKTDRGYWSMALCQLVEFASRGGIVATMHHWLNPAHPENEYADGELDTMEDWTNIVTKGTELNQAWHKELDIAGEFLSALHDAGVTFMFRPMLEANGGWFWWGCHNSEGIFENDYQLVSKKDMVNLWRYVHDYYTKDLGLTNILWSYAPNITNEYTYVDIMYYYPGDNYCDIVGVDWYTNGNYEIGDKDNDWGNLLDTRKIAGFQEFGLTGNLKTDDKNNQVNVFNCEDYVKIFERMISEGKNLTFVDIYSYWFGAPSFAGKGEALANCEYIVSLAEMPALIAEILK